MINIKNILKKNNIKAIKYKKYKSATIIYTKDNKYVVDKINSNSEIIELLKSKTIECCPTIIDKDSNIELREYIDDILIPKEAKMNDLIKLVGLIHLKTSFYKEVGEVEYKKLYEDVMNNLEYLKDYYKDIINIIESKVFMSPSEYLFALNITLLFDSINYGFENIKKWYEMVKHEKNRMRVCVINNDLSLNHFYKNEKSYLTNWDKSRIDMPIFDLYKLYLRNNKDFDFIELLKIYEKIYPLKDYELLLLYIFISMPSKIEFNLSEFEMCNKIQDEVDRLIKASVIINNYRSVKKTLENA